MHATRRRFWFELSFAIASALLAVLTLVSKDWIEVISGQDPDEHSGSLEWLIVIVFACIFVASSLAARYEWRRSVRLGAKTD